MITGKGMWIWIVQRCGAPAVIARAAKDGGLSHMLVKICDGTKPYYGLNYGEPFTGYDWSLELIRELKAVGITPVGWAYVYGDNPIGEAMIAITRMLASQVDYFVIDAESEYKRQGFGAHAVQYCQYIRERVNIQLGLSTFRFPYVHPEFPWGEFGQFMDLYMPQVYWQDAHNPVEQLMTCKAQYERLPYPKPIIPAGAAYREHGWQPTQIEVQEFLEAAKLTFPSANLWEWYDAKISIPELWAQIAAFIWSGNPPPPPPPEPLPQFFTVNNANGLNIRSVPNPYSDAYIIGSLMNGKKLKPIAKVIGADSKEWWQINEFAFVAKWLTR